MKAKINEILDKFRSYVATHDYRKTPILTVYVDIDPTNPDNRKERPAWLIELRNEAKKLRDSLPEEERKRRAAQEKWSRTEEFVLAYLQDRKPEGRSVAMFTDLEDFIAVDLPVTLPTRVYYGVPQLKHLLFAMDMYEKYLVVLCSGAEVRCNEVFLNRTTDELRAESPHRSLQAFGRKAKTLAYDRRGLEFERRYVRELAAGIDEYFMGDPEFRRIVFGGNLKQAHAVKRALHPATAEMVVAMEPMDAKLSDVEIAERVTKIANQYELEHDRAVVNDLIERYHAKGAAVLERQGVEMALQKGAVKTLVLPYPIGSEDFDPLLIDATLHNAEIEFVLGDAAAKLNQFGGIGACLYYSAS
jgi:hypothetical protein